MSNPDGTIRIRRALVSVYDKTGLEELATGLHDAGVADRLHRVDGGAHRRRGRPGGRGRGAHRLPRVPRRPGQDAAPAGARRASSPTCASTTTSRSSTALGIEPFDLVVVNLYPFTADRRLRRQPRRVRRADRHRRPVDGARRPPRTTPSVAVVTSTRRATPRCSPRCGAGGFTLAERARAGRRGVRAHRHLRRRGRVVDGQRRRPDRRGLRVPGVGRRDAGSAAAVLRYGENPHQGAALYTVGALPGRPGLRPSSCTARRCRTTTTSTPTPPAARRTTSAEPAVAIIKHANPCGIAVGADVAEAHRKAHDCDPVSAFGGVIAANRPVTVEMAAPGRRDLHRGHRRARRTTTARSRCCTAKKNIRLLVAPRGPAGAGAEIAPDLRRPAAAARGPRSTPRATTRPPGRWPPASPPTPTTLADLEFAWRACRR